MSVHTGLEEHRDRLSKGELLDEETAFFVWAFAGGTTEEVGVFTAETAEQHQRPGIVHPVETGLHPRRVVGDDHADHVIVGPPRNDGAGLDVLDQDVGITLPAAIEANDRVFSLPPSSF